MLDRQRLNARSLLWVLALTVAVLASAAGLSAQAFEDELADLRGELAESFEVLALSDGWLFQPIEESGFRSLEVRGSELAIDGVVVSADEVSARLGGLGAPVLAFAQLDTGDRLAVFGEEESEIESTAAAEAEGIAVEQAATSSAEQEARRERTKRHHVNRSDAQVVVGSDVTIEADEIARDVVVVGGSLVVEGEVRGDAVAVGGSVDVTGEVRGDVAAIGASVDLGPEAVVSGDVVSIGGSVHEAPGSVVEGMVQEVAFFPSLTFGGWSGSGARIKHAPDIDVDISPRWRPFDVIWSLFGVALLVIFAALTLLIAPKPVDRVGQQAAEEPWKSGLVGLLSQILFFPLLVILVLILVISIVGIPFLLLLPFVILALALICLLGYTAIALRIGRWSEERFGWRFTSPFIALLVGIGLIEVWSIVADILSGGPGPIKLFAFMFGLFGGLLCYAVLTVGFGAAILSRVGTASDWGGGGAAAQADWNVPLDDGSGSAEVAAAGDEIDRFDGSDFGGGSLQNEDWVDEPGEEPQGNKP